MQVNIKQYGNMDSFTDAMDTIGKFLQKRFPDGIGAEGMEISLNLPDYPDYGNKNEEKEDYIFPLGGRIVGEWEHLCPYVDEKLTKYLKKTAEEYTSNEKLKARLVQYDKDIASLEEKQNAEGFSENEEEKLRKLRLWRNEIPPAIEMREQDAPIIAAAAENREHTFYYRKKFKDGSYQFYCACTVKVDGMYYAIREGTLLHSVMTWPVDKDWAPDGEEECFMVGNGYYRLDSTGCGLVSMSEL